jgi:cytochrome c-type biogenesis protein CcmH/NrfG
MNRDAVIFGIGGTCFGLLAGWIIGSQQASAKPVVMTAAAPQSAPAVPGGEAAPPPLDLQQVAALEQQAKARPTDATVRVALGNLYFDSGKYDQAVPWYEAAVKLNPKDVDASTDLAVCYYYINDADKALKQIAQSLAIDPRHPKTLLNQGIIRAFGKQDLTGAMESWEKVVQYAPNTPEAARAKTGLDGLKGAHQGGTNPAGTGSGRGGL